METEFKEKTYEKYFCQEVARLTNITFSPDQCDEAFLGFDDAFFLPYDWIFRRTPFVRRGRRARMMRGVRIQDFEHIGAEIGYKLPPFRFNLFVQYKRPTFLTSHRASQWSDWQNPYYRYTTTPHQQRALEKIELHSKGRAATVYSSPAFWKAGDLWRHVETEAVIENSNIASAARLTGHDHYSYDSAGFQGKGHSETTDIESPALETLVARGLEEEPLPFNAHVKQAAKLIIESIDDRDGRILFDRAYAALRLGAFSEESLVSALTTIEAFSDAFGVSYIAIG